MSFDNKDFTNRDLSECAGLSGKTIIGSCFSQEIPRNPFPAGMTGTTFVSCNLDNCLVPVGNTIDPSCSHRLFACQIDGYDWIVDDNLHPLTPLNLEYHIENGLNTDPTKIKPRG